MSNKIAIADDLRQLSTIGQITFGASCCERLLPNYQAFSLIENWGDFQKLRSILDEIWIGLENKELLMDLKELPRSEIINLAPDTEEFITLFTSMAGDAVAAVVYTVEAIAQADKSLENILLVVQVAQNSIFQYLGAVNDPVLGNHAISDTFEDNIFHYPLMKAEIEKQMEDIDYLKKNPILTGGHLSTLKNSSSNCGIQPIKRGFLKYEST